MTWFFQFAALLLGLDLTIIAGDLEMNEYRVKALFLYNFTQFIQWPVESFKDTSQPLTICIVSPSPFEAGELERAIAGKWNDSHPLTSRLIRDADEGAGCHIVFVSAGSIKRSKSVTANAGQMGILTIGEAPGFARSGGMINLLIKNGRVQLEINVAAAERGKLHLSAKLLKLAEIVK